MFKKFKILSIFALASALITGCIFDGGGNLGEFISQDSKVVVSTKVSGQVDANAKTGVLAKSSVITYSKVVLILSSTANDTIKDTITPGEYGFTSTSTTEQVVEPVYTLKALRGWKIVAYTLDTKDSVINKDSTTISVGAGREYQTFLNLTSKFTMFSVNVPIKDSISSVTGSFKQKLFIKRVLVEIGSRVIRDTVSPTYITALDTVKASYDYETVGNKLVKVSIFGHLDGAVDTSNTLLLYYGTVASNVPAGSDSTLTLNLVYQGPQNGTDTVNVTIGKVGTVTIGVGNPINEF